MNYPEWDERLSNKIRIDENKKGPLLIARIFAHSGDSWLWCGILFILWLISNGENEKIIAYWGGSIALTALFVFFLKRIISRKRPEGEWGNVYRKGDPYSFPSGHAARAGVIIILASDTFNEKPILFALIIIWAILMTISRVVTGLHYIFDIIAGLFLGLALGVLWVAVRPWILQTFSILFNKSLWFQ